MPRLHGQQDVSHRGISPQPNPDADGNYHQGDGVTAPRVLFAPEPQLTEEARRKRISGVVILWLLVDPEGKPHDVRVSHSLAAAVAKEDKIIASGLDDNAIKAAQHYRFAPAMFQGKPVPLEIEVKVNYRAR